VAARNPAIVVGGGVDRAGGWPAAVALAERLNAPVWEAPAPERASFPQDHPLFQGFLPLAMKPLADRLSDYDLVLVVGAPIFRYYPHIPGPIVKPNTQLVHLTDDPDEAARAPAGWSIVGDPRAGLERLLELASELPLPAREPPPARPAPQEAQPRDPISVDFALRALANAMPDDAVVVEESASSRAAFYDQIRITKPSSYFATASGGLGFAVPAAVGVGLARPGTPVVCIAGDGATMFGVQAIWSAARYEIPVVYVIINNGHYGILKAFADFQRTPGVPGLDLPGLDITTIARGFGAEAIDITSACELPQAYEDAFHRARAHPGPVLLNITVDASVGALLGQGPD
jgi:benzoylformate decarboxylase